jgi:photosystem II stability/assembly factor-like uncharacterized protein
MKAKHILFYFITTLLFSASIIQAQWVQTSGPFGGKINSFTSYGLNLFVGTGFFESGGSGVFRSTNNGTSWTQVNNGLTNYTVHSLATSGSNLFAGTSNGVFRSTNNGTSWTQVNNGLPDSFSAISLLVSNSNIFVGSYGHVYRSTNNGSSWLEVFLGLPNFIRVNAFAVSGTNIFAGTDNGVFRSTDNGSSWTQVNNGLTSLQVHSLATIGNNIFVGTNNCTFISTDNGSSWNQISNGMQIYSQVFSLQANGTNLFAGTGGSGVYYSSNNGTIWTQVNDGLTDTQVFSLFSLNTNVFAGTISGVSLTTNNGANWTQVNNGIINTEICSIINKGSYIFAATNGSGIFRSTNNGSSWTQVINGLPYLYVQSLAVSGTLLFAGSEWFGVFLSTNNGSSWTQINNGITNLVIQTLIVSDNNIFAGSNGGEVFRSTNNGSSWSQVNNGLTTGFIYCFATSGSNLFAGTNDGVFRSTNNGSSWTQVNNGLTSVGVPALAVSGTRLFAGTYNGVFTSTNNGSSWTQVNNGLTDLYVQALSTDGTNLFVGTQSGGVFISTNNGSNWYQVNDGLTDTFIRSLLISDLKLFVGTFANGIWRRPLSEIIEDQYVLKRVVNGITEEFSLNNHSWSFDNDSTNMWPQTWWSQFDYCDPIYLPEWCGQINSSDFPDWPLFVDAFGVYQCYVNPPPLINIEYKEYATKKWEGIKNTWRGSCFGFAISSFLFFDQKLSLSTIFPNYQKLYNIPIGNASRKLVNLYFIYQYGKNQLGLYEANSETTPNETFTGIKNMILDVNRDDRILLLVNQNKSSAHAVNPYKIKEGQTIDTIFVYDNSLPGLEKKIYVNKINNTWNYPDKPGYGGLNGLYLSDPMSNYLTNPILLPSSNARDHYVDDNKTEIDFFELYNSYNSNILIKNSIGDSIGFKNSDSSWFSNFEDGIPIIPITGSDHPPIGYYIPNDNYHIELSNVQDSSVYVSFFSDSLAFSINRNNSIPTDVDKFNFESINHKLEILNPDNKAKIYDVCVIISGEESEKVLEVNNLEMSLNDSLNFYPEENENLKVENIGAEKSYNLNIKLASASGESIFEYSNISLAANSSHTILPEWQNLDSVTIYVDNGNNGTIDDSVTVVNQYTSLFDEEEIIPTEFKLFQNYPNPFNPITTLKYSIAKQSNVAIIIYDVLGREVTTLVNEEKPIGNYTVEFNAGNLSSGIYFYRIHAGSFVDTKKMILIK